MALYSPAFVLFVGWSYLCGGYCAILKDHFVGLKRKVESGHSVAIQGKDHSMKDNHDLILQDTVTEHMQMLYTKYNQAGFPFKDGNTVRSFKAHWGMYPNAAYITHVVGTLSTMFSLIVFLFGLMYTL